MARKRRDLEKELREIAGDEKDLDKERRDFLKRATEREQLSGRIQRSPGGDDFLARINGIGRRSPAFADDE